MVLAAIYVLAWLGLFGMVGWYVAAQCGRHWVEGLLLGGLLGPVGLFLVVFLPRSHRGGSAPIRRATDERQVASFLEQLK
jgi:hypothetical protein